ncbi:hypothetical protein [Lutispora sp.]|uniref:hypothetical protein n=1 Tax=Lutispora sp. TaxID=2828727 RepID=UPI002B209B06|nr:hypothetical protein [Lutispora sp.]MEA4963822.1 hypothetical protein [Lutispora sp.]
MRRFICILLTMLILVGCRASAINDNIRQEDDGMIDPEDINLLYINGMVFSSGFHKYYDSNLYNIQKHQDYQAKTISNIMSQHEIQFISLSSDGSKALFETIDSLPIYKVFDLKSKEIVFEIEDSDYDISMGMYMHIKFLPNLTKFVKIKEDGYYLCSTDGNTLTKLKDLNNVNLFNCVFSPDESMIAFTEEIKDDKYISIYDMIKKRVTKKIKVGGKGLYINQWHNSGKLLYNYDLNGYMIDIDTEKVKDLGKYVFYPLLSPGGRYLAYSHTITFAYIDSMLDIDGAYEDTAGLYILDNNTGNTIKLDTDNFFQQEPLQWIDSEVGVLIKE